MNTQHKFLSKRSSIPTLNLSGFFLISRFKMLFFFLFDSILVVLKFFQSIFFFQIVKVIFCLFLGVMNDSYIRKNATQLSK